MPSNHPLVDVTNMGGSVVEGRTSSTADIVNWMLTLYSAIALRRRPKTISYLDPRVTSIRRTMSTRGATIVSGARMFGQQHIHACCRLISTSTRWTGLCSGVEFYSVGQKSRHEVSCAVGPTVGVQSDFGCHQD